jgi:CRP-like cAMP-binding protein
VAISSPSALQLYLNRLLLRSRLDEAERAAVLALPNRAVQIKTYTDFVRLGEAADHACLIVAGLVGRFDQTAAGRRQIVALHIAGDMADLHSLVAPTVSWALQALCPTTILRIPHVALTAMIHEHPSLGLALWRDCEVDACILAQWLVNIGRRDAGSRLAHLICEMYLRYEHLGEAAALQFSLPVTQTLLGDMLGLTAVHVNRMLKLLRAKGIASKVADVIAITDWNALVRVAEFDPAYLQMLRPSADRLAAA